MQFQTTQRKPPTKAGVPYNNATKQHQPTDYTERAVIGGFIGMRKSVGATARMVWGRTGSPARVEQILRERLIQAGVDWKLPQRRSA